MGFFDKLKNKMSKAKKESEKPDFNNVLFEIVKIVSCNNTEVLETARECIYDIDSYYKSNVSDYENRCISEKEDECLLKWIGCIDLLLNNGLACECDWKDDRDEFIYQISLLIRMNLLNLSIDKDSLCEDEDITEWCRVLDKKWSESGYTLCAFDINSDSYVMFLCSKCEACQLKDLAESIELRIDYVWNM